MSSPIQTIKDRLSIVDVISSYLKVEKAGKNYKAKCPFHNEKTPSFFISPEKGGYYCFGCGAKGDIFSFVEHFEGINFLGSLKILAEKAGVEITSYKAKENDNMEIFYNIMEEAALFFEMKLVENKEARSYLINRGINDSSIKLFKIGYAPESWNALYKHLVEKKYKRQDIESVGLIKKKENGSNMDNDYYDRFRGRIMFPINDTSGRVIAFSGRIFKSNNGLSKNEEAKYLNSPDTPLFNKSNILFGIDKAKNYIRKRDYSIIVEGQMDLILSHQAQFTNTVAVSGTAFTDTTIDNESKINNLGLVRRLSSNIIFAYDGDDAGIRAASRSAMIALSLDMQVKIAVLPPGKDPADIILKNYNDWKEIIKNSKNIISFHIDKICQDSNDVRIRGKKIREVIFPFLSMIQSSIDKSTYIKEISSKTGINENAIIDDFKSFEKNISPNNTIKENKDNNDSLFSRRNNIEKKLFNIFFWKNADTEHLKIINKFKEIFEKDIGQERFEKMIKYYEPFYEDMALEAEMWYSDKADELSSDIEEMVLNLEEEILKEEALVLRQRINDKEKNNDNNELKNDLINYQKIVEKIENIKNRRLK